MTCVGRVVLISWYLSQIREWQKYAAQIVTLEGFESHLRRLTSRRPW